MKKFMNEDFSLPENWRGSEVFLHHTGHMFGIGASAFNRKAINRIISLKNRSNKEFIVLLPDLDWLDKFNLKPDKAMFRLMQQYWPGNLTFIVPDTDNNFSLVNKDNRIAIRIPDNKPLRQFINRINRPVISTSINKTGEKPLKTIREIENNYSDWYDFSLPFGKINQQYPQSSTIIAKNKNELVCLRHGSVDFTEITSSYQNPQVLYVCTANICRTPMAHYYSEKLVNDLNLPLRIKSAGFLPGGRHISENSAKVLAENDIKSEHHLSTQLNKTIVKNSWLILTMTTEHKNNLLEQFPEAKFKTFTLSEYDALKSGKSYSSSADISDPYMLDIYFYRETYKIITAKIDNIFTKLKKEF